MILRGFLQDASRFGLGKRPIATIVGLHLASTLFEVIGVGTIVPLGELMIAGGDVDGLIATSSLWQWMDQTLGAVGLPLGLATLLMITFLCMLIRQAFAYVRDVYINVLRERLIYETRMVGMRGYLEADLAFQAATPAGTLVNDLTTELGRALGSLFAAVSLLNYTIVGAAYFVVMLAISWQITLIATVTLAFGAFLLRGILHRSEIGGRMIARANEALSKFLVERLSQTRLIRLTGMEKAEMRAVHELADEQRHRMVAVTIMTARINSIIEPLSVSIGLILIFLGYSLFSLELPEIGLFLIMMMRLLPIAQLVMVTRQSYLANLASKRMVLERMDAMAASAEPQGGDKELVRLDQGIAFRDVAFAYPDRSGHKALYEVTLQVPAHRITALVGPSGSGKSTLIDLIPRLRLPDRGEVLFDGVPAEAFRLESLRRAMAYVPQAAQIFDVTAAEHIRYGKPDAGDEEVAAAARLAGAHDFIMSFPDGYRTRLGQVGSALSGGQRQRLDMARALVGKTPILLLDEPTSALDAEAEQAFRDALARIRAETDTTIIIVGHRLSTVRQADQIVVLRAGRVEDIGTHKALLARGGWYAAACRTQFDLGDNAGAKDAAVSAGVH